MARLALLLQLATTLPLVGVIWLVQVVAYPLFARVGAATFPRYHAAHARLITWVVGPLMLGELAGAGLSAWAGGPLLPRPLAWLGLLAVAALWIATAFVSVPRHDVLARGYDEAAWKALVATNWFRTALWTLRGGLVLWAAARAWGPAAAVVRP